MRTLSKHISSGRATLCDSTKLALSELRTQISLNVPRAISGKMSDHVHVYVDASYDPEGYSGVGGIFYDSTGQSCFFFSEQVSSEFLLSVKKNEQKNMIQELEMLALLIAAVLWLPMSEGKRVVIFSDSEAVRGSFLKSWSQNDVNSQLLKEIFRSGGQVRLPNLVRKGTEPIQPFWLLVQIFCDDLEWTDEFQSWPKSNLGTSGLVIGWERAARRYQSSTPVDKKMRVQLRIVQREDTLHDEHMAATSRYQNIRILSWESW